MIFPKFDSSILENCTSGPTFRIVYRRGKTSPGIKFVSDEHPRRRKEHQLLVRFRQYRKQVVKELRKQKKDRIT